jgi:hypothetical protein
VVVVVVVVVVAVAVAVVVTAACVPPGHAAACTAVRTVHPVH